MPKIRLLPQGVPLISVTDDYTATLTNQVIAADASGVGVSPLIVQLPAVGTSRSFEVVVANVGSSGTVTVDAFGTETIDGNLTYDLTGQWDAVTLTSVPGGWVLSAGGGGGGGEVYDDTIPGLGVTTFQGAVESLVVGAASTTFIYNSSGGQGGTRYNDWADLMAAIALTQYGGPRNILFEQNETIPVGAYDLTDITLLGNGIGVLGGGLIVTFQTGTTLTNDITRLGNGITVNWAGTGTLMDGTGSFTGVKALYLSDESAVFATGGGSFIAIDTGAEARLVAFAGQTNIFAGNASGFPAVNGYIVNCDTSATSATVVMVDNANGTLWTNDMLFVSSVLNFATITYFIYTDTVPAPPGIDLTTQTNAGPGAINYSGLSVRAPNASREVYTPAVLAPDWSGIPPTSLANALDRIAAAVGPIP